MISPRRSDRQAHPASAARPQAHRRRSRRQQPSRRNGANDTRRRRSIRKRGRGSSKLLPLGQLGITTPRPCQRFCAGPALPLKTACCPWHPPRDLGLAPPSGEVIQRHPRGGAVRNRRRKAYRSARQARVDLGEWCTSSLGTPGLSRFRFWLGQKRREFSSKACDPIQTRGEKILRQVRDRPTRIWPPQGARIIATFLGLAALGRDAVNCRPRHPQACASPMPILPEGGSITVSRA